MDTEKFIKLVFEQFFSITLIIIFLTILTTSISYLLPEKFESEATYKVRSSSLFSNNNQLGLLSGLASFEGSSQEVDIIEVEEVANSFEFTDKFINKYELEEKLVEKDKFSDNFPKRIDLFKIFHNNLSINVKGDYLSLAYADYDPFTAKKILENWAYELDEFFRVRENTRSQKAVDYLSESISKGTYISLYESLSSYAERELNNLVMTQVESQYLLKTIDSPNLPEYKKYPRRLVWLVISLFTYSLLTIISVISWNIKTSKRLRF